MCRSKADGGQRCASHALNRVTTTEQAIRYADDDDPTRSDRRVAAYRSALVEYASTTQGQVVLTAMYQDARRGAEHTTPVNVSTTFHDVLTEGQRLRHENTLVRAGWAREHAGTLDHDELERTARRLDSDGQDVDVPVHAAMTRRNVNPDDATYRIAPVSHYAKVARTANSTLNGRPPSPGRADGNDPAFMTTPHGQDCSPRPRNTFHDTTSLAQLDRDYTRLRGHVVSAPGPAARDVEAQILDRLRVDYQEQQFTFDHGHYPRHPFPPS